MKKHLVIWLLFVALVSCAASVFAAEDAYAPLRKKLIEEGFGRDRVSRLYQRPTAPLYKLISKTLHIQEGRLNYDQFLESASIARARNFQSKYAAALERAEKAYGVDGCVITAILLVETQFGQYTGRTPTLAVLSSFALMDQKQNRDKVWKLMPAQDREHWGREAFDQKLVQRSEWAYRELCALLEWQKLHGARPESFMGSVMGAVGWPQFLPSSLVQYGVDGDGDGDIDLYDSEDAIASTANYLKGHGWCEANTPEKQEAVIWSYNHSRPYISTVLGIAEKMKRAED